MNRVNGFIPAKKPWEKVKEFIDPESKIKVTISRLPLRVPMYSFSIGRDKDAMTEEGKKIIFINHVSFEFISGPSQGSTKSKFDYPRIVYRLLEQAEAWVLTDIQQSTLHL